MEGFEIRRREIKIQSRTNLNGGELERIRGREYQEKYGQRVLEGEIKLDNQNLDQPKWWLAGLIDN